MYKCIVSSLWLQFNEHILINDELKLASTVEKQKSIQKQDETIKEASYNKRE